MRRIFTVVSAAISLSAALSFAACGSSDSAKSAVAPSSVQPSTLGATIAGNIVSGPRTGLTVSVAGTAASARVDDMGAFTLEHVPAGDQVLGFAGPAVNAHLAMSGIVDHQAIRIRVRVDGGTADLDEDEREDAGKLELEGLIADLNVAARTLRIGTTIVMVPIGTTIRHGDTPFDLSQLHVGDRIHVKAAKSGTTVTANEILVQNQQQPAPTPTPLPTPPPTGVRVELSGAVQSMSGACPLLTLHIGTTTVMTNANTEFEDSPCTALTIGTTAEVKGTRQADNSVLASSVEFEREDKKDEGAENKKK